MLWPIAFTCRPAGAVTQGVVDERRDAYLPGLSLDVGAIGNAKVASGLIGLIGLLISGLGWVNSLREAMRTIWHQNINAGNVDSDPTRRGFIA